MDLPTSEVEGHRLPKQGHDPVQQEQLRAQAHSADTTARNLNLFLYISFQQ